MAQIADELRGGTNGFRADRRLAARIEEMWPAARRMLAWQDRFLARAAAEAVTAGTTAVIFGGAGFPAAGSPPHHLAAAAGPGTWLGYPDADTAIVTFRDWRLRTGGNTWAVAFAADLREPGPLLKAARDAGMGAGPVQVQWGMAASLMDGPEAAAVLAGYRDLLPPGSTVVLTAPPAEIGLPGVRPHDAAEMTRWYGTAGLVLRGPVRDVRAWWRDWGEAALPDDGPVIGAIGAVPA